MTTPDLERAARAGASVGVAQLGGLILSFLLSVAIAAFFGSTRVTDAHFMAASTAELLAKIFLGSSLAAVFLPIFVSLLDAPAGRVYGGAREIAAGLLSALITLALGAFLLLGGLLELFADPLITFHAPGFSPATHDLTVTIFRIVLPAYLAAFLADLLIVPYHAHRRFAFPAATRLLVPLLTLLAVLAFAQRIGVVTLAAGTLLGTTAQAVLLALSLRRLGVRLRLRAPWAHPEVGRVLRLTLPFAVSILAAYGAGTVYRILVSGMPEGSLASLKFAEKIFNLANALFLGSIAQVAFPIFARAAASGSPELLRDHLRTAARAVLFLGLPLTVGVVLLRLPLVRVLYERGAFTTAATTATATLLPLFVVGLLGNGVSSLLGHATLALQATRTIVAVNVALQAIAASLFVVVTPRLGVAGLALVSGLGPFILTALYLWTLRTRIPGLTRSLLDRRLAALLLAAAACTVAVRASILLTATLPTGLFADLLRLSIGALGGSAAYLGTAWLLHVPEVAVTKALLQRAFRLVGVRA